jgi:hypothetical protein
MEESQVFRFRQYSSGGRKKVMVEAEYPDGLGSVRRGPPWRKKARTAENGNGGDSSGRNNPNGGILHPTAEFRPPGPSGERRQPNDPPVTPIRPAAEGHSNQMPAHSYQGFLPPPLPDGSGPLLEIQHQSVRMGMGPQEISVGSHFARPAAAPAAIDPALMQTPEGPALIQTPRRNHAIVLMTPRAELRAVAPAVTPSWLRPRPRPIPRRSRTEAEVADPDSFFLRRHEQK